MHYLSELDLCIDEIGNKIMIRFSFCSQFVAAVYNKIVA